jgi:3-hydroxyisobutyrate dehydrogenase
MTDIVAVLGLGAMGLPMATRLRERFQVRGFDIDPDRRQLAQQADVTAADTARAAAGGAAVALLAVRNRAQLDDALYGQDGIAEVLADGAAVVLTSTVGGAAVAEVAGQLSEQGLHLIDAPVSGGPARAGSGELLITVGADDDAYRAGQEVLEQLAGTLVRVGGRAGDGQAMKTVNQLLCGVHIAAAGKALALASALGLDPQVALDALQAGAAQSFMLGDRGPRMLQAYDDEAPEVKSRLDIFVKDMGIVNSAARDAGLATPIAAAAEGLFLIGQANGDGAQDDSSVIRVIAPNA